MITVVLETPLYNMEFKFTEEVPKTVSLSDWFIFLFERVSKYFYNVDIKHPRGSITISHPEDYDLFRKCFYRDIYTDRNKWFFIYTENTFFPIDNDLTITFYSPKPVYMFHVQSIINGILSDYLEYINESREEE